MKGLLLISGGIDSPVAGKMMIERGASLIAIHFSNEPFTSDEPEKKSLETAKIIGVKKVIVINLSEEFSQIVKNCNHRYYFVLTKRLMLRVAEKIAGKEDCDFLVTGENLGQVSSQTLENLAIIDEAVDICVHRPLLTFDKNQIIDLAREIDTYEISKGPEMCCVLGPNNPATRSKLTYIRSEEEKISDILNSALRKVL